MLKSFAISNERLSTILFFKFALGHNGEINTLRGNKNWMFSREGLMSSPLFGEDHPNSLIQATSNNMSDSGNFDSVLVSCRKLIVSSILFLVI